jgi:hypothetical protein
MPGSLFLWTANRIRIRVRPRVTHNEIAVRVARAPDEAFACLSSFEKAPLWQSGVVEAHVTSPPPRRVGSRFNRLKQLLDAQPA